MARWDPGAEDRLRQAAMDLFLERGFEAVTATDIAVCAGLTRRTFFRYFADKREVLFAGQDVKLINFSLPVPTTDKVPGIAEFVAPEQVDGRPVEKRSENKQSSGGAKGALRRYRSEDALMSASSKRFFNAATT